MKFKAYWTLLFVFLLSCGVALGACSPGAEEDGDTIEAEIATIVAATLTQEAIAQPEQVLGDQPSSDVSSGEEGGAAQAEGVAGIPELDVVFLLEGLVEFGFDCAASESRDDVFARACNFETAEYQFSVTLWGKSPDTVDLIEAVALYFGDEDYSSLTSIVFEKIAETPYEDAEPDAARTWVQATLPGILAIGDEAATTFGGVRYYLYAFPSSQVLEIGGLQE